MKKYIFFIVAIVTLYSCKTATGVSEFEVKGTIANNSAKKVYLQEIPMGMNDPKMIDSATIDSKGAFLLHGKATEMAMYNLMLDNVDFPVASVINDGKTIELAIKLNKEQPQLTTYEVKGSEASQSILSFMTKFNKDIESIYNEAVSLDSLSRIPGSDSILNSKAAAQKQSIEALHKYALGEINATKIPALAIFKLGYYQSTVNAVPAPLKGFTDTEVTAVIDKLVKENPNHTGIAKIQENLKKSIDAQAAKSLIGKPAPEFALPDPSGTTIALSSLKGKYVLVDFWASWCKPCRIENPNVVAAYQKFKDKNFTILGVSLDKDKDSWVEAIKADNLSWAHVSDLKYWESAVVPMYGIEGIPFNVLLDPQGNIIADRLTGPALEAKLAEVLK